MNIKEVMKVAVVGLGSRGSTLIPDAILPAAEDYGIEIAAVLDIYQDRTKQGADITEEQTGKRPKEAASYEEILTDPDIDAVIITAAWEPHIPMAIAAMKAGKYAAFEVGGAYSVEDCWQLVHTYEETGIPCMLLENCCYDKRELMTLRMVREGLFGSIVHCSGGYCHDLREEIAYGRENRHYRLRNYMNRNCENYPTHELGPIAKLLDINNGNRMLTLTSTASSAKGLHDYVLRKKGAADPLTDVPFAQGDVVTTVIKCTGGQTITLTLDTTLPRTYSRGFTVRGTRGAYFGETDSIFLDGQHNEYEFKGKALWGNAAEFEEAWQHPLWKTYDPRGGHGGIDFLVLSAFFEAFRAGTRPPIDVYDAAAWMSITALSEASIAKGSLPVEIPDFTRGKWYMRNDIDGGLKFNLDRTDMFDGLYQKQ